MVMDLFSTLQLLHEAAISVLVTTIYGRWRGTTTCTGSAPPGSTNGPLLVMVSLLIYTLLELHISPCKVIRIQLQKSL